MKKASLMTILSFVFSFIFLNSSSYAETKKASDNPAATYKKICLQCHADTGMGRARMNKKTGKPMINAMMGPRITGLSEKYIIEQVNAVKTGARKTRNTMTMKLRIKNLNAEQIKSLAAYISKDLNKSAGSHKGMLEK